MVLRAIKNAFKLKENRGWDRIYFAIDLHSTVVKPNYSTDSISNRVLPTLKRGITRTK